MLIIGAKGFAKEVYEVLLQEKVYKNNLAFYDDVSFNFNDYLYGIPIIKSEENAKQFFKKIDNKFTIGVGGVSNRYKLMEKFIALGGQPASIVSIHSRIGQNDNFIGEGTCIMTGTIITSTVKIGRGCLINLNCTIGHDVTIGDFCELSPTVNISGRCKIGDLVTIGTSATILPDIRVGNNVTIGAGTVVNKEIPDNAVVVGVPGKVIKYNEPLKF